MERVIYERPREKLRLRGVASLTTTELLQTIIGSGTSQMPVARLARKISEVLSKAQGKPTYSDFHDITGVGDATICRVLAALQLAQRYENLGVQVPLFDITSIRKGRKRSIIYVTLDGSRRQIASYTDKLNPLTSTSVLARRICAKALADSAHGFAVAFFTPEENSEPSIFELSCVAELKDIAQRLQLHIFNLEYFTKVSQRSL